MKKSRAERLAIGKRLTLARRKKQVNKNFPVSQKDRIRRFPRPLSYRDFTFLRARGVHVSFYGVEMPLKIKQKKLIRLIAEGRHSVRDCCDKVGVCWDTYFRWKRNNPLFRTTLEKAILAEAQRVIETADALLPRAVENIRAAMDSENEQLRTDVSLAIARGRGILKRQIEQTIDANLKGTIKSEKTVKVKVSPEDRERFLEFLLGQIRDTRRVKEITDEKSSVIDVEAEEESET